jgi:uncharacterized membrane protein YkvA (DUF1232 family)
MSKLKRLLSFGKKVKHNLILYRKVLKDERTPLMPKVLLWIALGYLLMPFDIIPDFIPILGQLDDLLIVALLIYIAIKLIPKDLISEYRINFT